MRAADLPLGTLVVCPQAVFQRTAKHAHPWRITGGSARYVADWRVDEAIAAGAEVISDRIVGERHETT